MVEVVVVGAEGGGLEHGDGRAPVVALGRSGRMVVEAGEAREVAGRDESSPRDVLEITRKLSPEGRLEVDVLAHRYGAGLGEGRLDVGDTRVELV